MDATTAALLHALRYQRTHVLGAVDGLSHDALHRPVLPTGWSCLGLVHHLAIDVERLWFRAVVAGEDLGDDAPELQSGWAVPASEPAASVLELYQAEAERSDAVIAATPLSAPPAAWPEHFGDRPFPDLRAIMLHVITETACHAGHLDAARELLDGGTWLILE